MRYIYVQSLMPIYVLFFSQTSQHKEEIIGDFKIKSTLSLYVEPNQSESLLIKCNAQNSLGSSEVSSPFLLTGRIRDNLSASALMWANVSVRNPDISNF